MGRRKMENHDLLLPDQPAKKRKTRNVFKEVVDKLKFQSQGYNKMKNDSYGEGMNDYYVKQAGSGIGGFSGLRYQKGDGFFGRMVSGAILPLIRKFIPFLGSTALSTGMNIMSDVSSGQKFKESAGKRFRETANDIGDKAMAKVKSLTGSGRKRRRVKRIKPQVGGQKKTRKRRKMSGRGKRKTSKLNNSTLNFL